VLKGEIVAFRRDIESDMYKDADVKYRDKMIELKVCYVRPFVVIYLLETFWHLLVMSFHPKIEVVD